MAIRWVTLYVAFLNTGHFRRFLYPSRECRLFVREFGLNWVLHLLIGRYSTGRNGRETEREGGRDGVHLSVPIICNIIMSQLWLLRFRKAALHKVELLAGFQGSVAYILLLFNKDLLLSLVWREGTFQWTASLNEESIYKFSLIS